MGDVCWLITGTFVGRDGPFDDDDDDDDKYKIMTRWLISPTTSLPIRNNIIKENGFIQIGRFLTMTIRNHGDPNSGWLGWLLY